MTLCVSLCLFVCLSLPVGRAPCTEDAPYLSFLHHDSDHCQGASVLGWLPSASSFTEVTEMQPAGSRLAPVRALAPGLDLALLSSSCLLLVSKSKMPFSPISSPIHSSCFYNALCWAVLPLLPQLQRCPLRCGLASPCTQAFPGKDL